MKTAKKALSLLLICVMALTLVLVPVQAADRVTVYVDITGTGWGNVNVYTWNESGECTGSWPGSAMTHVVGYVYCFEVPVSAKNIIFNDGNGVQTADLLIPSEGGLFDNVTNEWTDIKNYTPPTPPSNTEEEVTVTVKDDAGWGDVYIYYWDADGAEAMVWPGTPMEMDENGNYVATIPAGFYSVIFNNGGSWEDGSLLQTPDLKIPTDGKTFISNGDNCLYNEGSADDNNAWQSAGKQPETDKPGTDAPGTDEPGTDAPGTDEAPVEPKPMTFLQKIAKALLLFIRKMQDMFNSVVGKFKK